MSKNKGMRSIWFLVGLIMFIIGVIVVIAGIYDLVNPISHHIRLTNLHANIWWGVIITITGIIYLVSNRKNYVDR